MRNEKNHFPVFGTPEYLTSKFNDISKVTVSKESKTSRDFKELVKRISTEKDNMHVYKVFHTEGVGCEGNLKGYVAHVSIGLNGSGRQSDYLDAIKRLIKNNNMKVFLFDACIDAVDDLMDILVRIG